MKFLRMTFYRGPNNPQVTVAMNADDVVTDIDLDEIVAKMSDAFDDYVGWETFEADDEITGVLSAAKMAEDPMVLARENHEAVAYYYDGMMLGHVTDGGVLSTSAGSPLSRESCVKVLQQVARHSNYKNQTVILHDQDFNPVTMKGGEIVE